LEAQNQPKGARKPKRNAADMNMEYQEGALHGDAFANSKLFKVSLHFFSLTTYLVTHMAFNDHSNVLQTSEGYQGQNYTGQVPSNLDNRSESSSQEHELQNENEESVMDNGQIMNTSQNGEMSPLSTYTHHATSMESSVHKRAKVDEEVEDEAEAETEIDAEAEAESETEKEQEKQHEEAKENAEEKEEEEDEEEVQVAL